MEREVGQEIGPDNIVGIALESRRLWRTTMGRLERIVQERENFMREREGMPNP